MTNRRVFTLIKPLAVISIIALLITLLAPAIEGVSNAAQVAGYANNQHQLLIALHALGADNDGKVPPPSGYADAQLYVALCGSGDFFDVLEPQHMRPDPRDSYLCLSLYKPTYSTNSC